MYGVHWDISVNDFIVVYSCYVFCWLVKASEQINQLKTLSRKCYCSVFVSFNFLFSFVQFYGMKHFGTKDDVKTFLNQRRCLKKHQNNKENTEKRVNI